MSECDFSGQGNNSDEKSMIVRVIFVPSLSPELAWLLGRIPPLIKAQTLIFPADPSALVSRKYGTDAVQYTHTGQRVMSGWNVHQPPNDHPLTDFYRFLNGLALGSRFRDLEV